jgi:hypothetical protein
LAPEGDECIEIYCASFDKTTLQTPATIKYINWLLTRLFLYLQTGEEPGPDDFQKQ